MAFTFGSRKSDEDLPDHPWSSKNQARENLDQTGASLEFFVCRLRIHDTSCGEDRQLPACHLADFAHDFRRAMAERSSA